MGVDAEKYACYVNKLRQTVGLETWKFRQIVTSQTAHTKCKWPPYDPEPPPLPAHENFLPTPLIPFHFTKLYYLFNKINAMGITACGSLIVMRNSYYGIIIFGCHFLLLFSYKKHSNLFCTVTQFKILREHFLPKKIFNEYFFRVTLNCKLINVTERGNRF